MVATYNFASVYIGFIYMDTKLMYYVKRQETLLFVINQII